MGGLDVRPRPVVVPLDRRPSRPVLPGLPCRRQVPGNAEHVLGLPRQARVARYRPQWRLRVVPFDHGMETRFVPRAAPVPHEPWRCRWVLRDMPPVLADQLLLHPMPLERGHGGASQGGVRVLDDHLREMPSERPGGCLTAGPAAGRFLARARGMAWGRSAPCRWSSSTPARAATSATTLPTAGGLEADGLVERQRGGGINILDEDGLGPTDRAWRPLTALRLSDR